METAAVHETGEIYTCLCRREVLSRHWTGLPTTNPYNPSATTNVLIIVITKNLSFPVYLTSCSALSSDNLLVRIDNTCRPSFHQPPDRTDRANFQTHLEDLIPFDPEFQKEVAFDTCVENLTGSDLNALAPSTRKRRPLDDPRPPIPAGIRSESLNNRLWRKMQNTRNLVPRTMFNRLHKSVTRRLNDWRNDNRSSTVKSLDPKDQSMWRVTKRVMRLPTPYSPCTPRGEKLTQILRKPKSVTTVWILRFSWWQIFRSRQLLKWLTWRSDLTSWPLTTNLILPTLTKCTKLTVLSRSARLRGRTVSQTGFEASSQVNGFTPRPYLKCVSPHPPLSTRVELR